MHLLELVADLDTLQLIDQYQPHLVKLGIFTATMLEVLANMAETTLVVVVLVHTLLVVALLLV